MRNSSPALGAVRDAIARLNLSQDQYNYVLATSLLRKAGLYHVDVIKHAGQEGVHELVFKSNGRKVALQYTYGTSDGGERVSTKTPAYIALWSLDGDATMLYDKTAASGPFGRQFGINEKNKIEVEVRNEAIIIGNLHKIAAMEKVAKSGPSPSLWPHGALTMH